MAKDTHKLKQKELQSGFCKLISVLLMIQVIFSSRLLCLENQTPALPHVVRFIAAYEKTEDGCLVNDCLLKPISIEKLRSFFNVHDVPGDVYTRALARDMVNIYPLDERTAKLLQPYIDVEINLDKYDYFLEARSKKDYKDPENAEYYLPPEDNMLPAFPDARPIKPKYRESESCLKTRWASSE